MEWLSNAGSVDDIRCSLQHRNPQKPSEIREDIAWLNENLNYEIRNKNRSSVIKLIRSAIRRYEKQLLKSGALMGKSSIYK